MTRRRLLGVTAVAIAVAVAIVAFAGRDGTPPPAQGQEPRPAAGDHTGASSQRLPVTATVAKDRRTLTLDVRWRCTSPRDPAAGGVLVFRHRSVKISRDGSFSAAGRLVGRPGSAVQTARVAGRTDASGGLSGTWSGAYEDVTADTDIRCASGDVTFDLRRRQAARGAGDLRIALDGPREVAAAAGRVWVLAQGQLGPAVVSIDPRTGRASTRARLGSQNASVAPPGVAFPPVLAAGAGAAWVVTGILGPQLELTRVDGRTGEMRRIAVALPAPAPGRAPAAFQSVAVGAGAVWMLVGDHVLRLDPHSGRLVRAIRLTPAPPAGTERHCGRGVGRGAGLGLQADRLAVGAGAVWVASKCGPRPSRLGFLSRIDPRTNRVTRAVALRRSYSAIAAGRAGIWLATATATLLTARPPQPALHRLDARDGRTITVARLPEDSSVTGLAVDRDAVWVTESSAPQPGAPPVGALRRTRGAGGPMPSVARLERPAGVAVGASGVWVVDAFAGTVRRVPR